MTDKNESQEKDSRSEYCDVCGINMTDKECTVIGTSIKVQGDHKEIRRVENAFGKTDFKNLLCVLAKISWSERNMRKIELQNYMVKVPAADGKFMPKPYNVKESMVSCLLHPVLKLTGRELLLRNKLATHIEEAEIVGGHGFILVEEEDYRKLRQAFETIEGFTKSDMELVRRVLEAEEIEVAEKDAVKNAKDKLVKGRRERT